MNCDILLPVGFEARVGEIEAWRSRFLLTGECDNLADDGRAVLIDLDSFSRGPREWDLIQTAIFYDRFGWHTAEEYETFVRIYGYDIMGWSGYRDLANMREVAMTAWLSRKAVNSARSAAEAAKRLSAMRTGASRRDWSAY